ncbi:histidine phosphatase family protein [Streptomyces sp. NPDC048484]|uniref:histidine phosphatase family protein n=1 Tax=Streptomyces sp. NPDC048484 TaxID=3155146 RepID=UPI0034376C09
MRELIVDPGGGSRGNPGPAGYGAVVTDAAPGEPGETPAERAESAEPTERAEPGERAGRPDPSRSEAPHKGRGELRAQPEPAGSPPTTSSPPTTGSGPTTESPPTTDSPRNVAQPPPDLSTPTTFVLLRHGETPLTSQKRFSGSGGSDPVLSDAGRHQAERVASELAARGTVQAIASSPLTRCRETAEIVAAALGLGVRIEDGLRETDFGAWEGLTFAEVRERHPDDMNAWLGSADAAPTGGGESFETVARRVTRARDDLLAAYASRTVLLVSHVTPIKTLVRLALGAPPESLYRMEVSAASLSAVAYYADGNASVRLLNDTSALS